MSHLPTYKPSVQELLNAELERCKKDVVYFAERYLRVKVDDETFRKLTNRELMFLRVGGRNSGKQAFADSLRAYDKVLAYNRQCYLRELVKQIRNN